MKIISAISTVMLVASWPALAGCKEDVAQLDSHAHDKATSSIATASGGQATAARREAESAEQGDADQAMRAKAALTDAKVALAKGDEEACKAAVAKVRST